MTLMLTILFHALYNIALHSAGEYSHVLLLAAAFFLDHLPASHCFLSTLSLGCFSISDVLNFQLEMACHSK